jgi:predicted GNAT family acetyltransferase
MEAHHLGIGGRRQTHILGVTTPRMDRTRGFATTTIASIAMTIVAMMAKR